MRREMMGFFDAVASAGPYANNMHYYYTDLLLLLLCSYYY